MKSEITGTGRESGYLLLELVIGLTVLTVGLLGFFFTFYANFRGGERMNDIDEVRVALDNAAELLRGSPFADVYTNFNATSVTAPGLLAPGGTPARVQFTCHVDETAMPAECGPIADLDGDGVLATANCSANYLILPVELSLTYVNSEGDTETRDLYVVLGDL